MKTNYENIKSTAPLLPNILKEALNIRVKTKPNLNFVIIVFNKFRRKENAYL